METQVENEIKPVILLGVDMSLQGVSGLETGQVQPFTPSSLGSRLP